MEFNHLSPKTQQTIKETKKKSWKKACKQSQHSLKYQNNLRNVLKRRNQITPIKHFKVNNDKITCKTGIAETFLENFKTSGTQKF